MFGSFLSSPAESQGFVTATAGSSGRVRGSTAMRGFKDDFMAWKATLTPEERALSLEQAQNEFNKNFKKTAKYTQKLPEDKIKSLGKILGKFLESEAEDYKKSKFAAMETGNDLIENKVARQNFDFRLTPRLSEIDREAERRYFYAKERFAAAKSKGESFWPGSPQVREYTVPNDEAAHANNRKWLDALLEHSKTDTSLSPSVKDAVAKFVTTLPPAGQEWTVTLPYFAVRYWDEMKGGHQKALQKKEAEMGKEAYDAWIASAEGKEESNMALLQMVDYASDKYVDGFQKVEKDVAFEKSWFRNADPMVGKTKADMVRELWKIYEQFGEKMPPLDEEILADLAKYPAYLEGEYKHAYGTADRLWKMEAIDAFGTVFILGVYETQEEAVDAFNGWNAEYESARAKMSEDVAQWEKKQDARLEDDADAQNYIKKNLDDARENYRTSVLSSTASASTAATP